MVFISSLIFAQTFGWADTGTYTILDYKVKLIPKSDGNVEIEYYQKWLVTGGDIPWITVGTPNSSFQIIQNKNKGAVRSIQADNYGSWSGVRIDLDKDYKPNETFEISFAITQNRLFYAEGNNYKLDFTPGWYDRAETNHLTLEIFFFAKMETVKAKPVPARTEGQSMFWEKSNLGKGEKFNISVSFPKTFFPTMITQQKPNPEFPWFFVFFIAIVIFILVSYLRRYRTLFSGHDRRTKYGSGGSIYYGGSSRGKGVSTGGGGGFGGRSFSCVCACACVGCACACACAGGGGAGCERKINHQCPLCKVCQNKQNCPIWKGTEA